MAERELPHPILILQYISSLPAIILSKIQRPPLPLLPVTAAVDDAHPIMQNIDKLELGKFAFTLATTAILGLLFSNTFPAAEAHYFVILGFMAACAAVLNGILFERVSLQLLGISLILLCFYGLVGSFLPPSFSSYLALSLYSPFSFFLSNLPKLWLPFF